MDKGITAWRPSISLPKDAPQSCVWPMINARSLLARAMGTVEALLIESPSNEALNGLHSKLAAAYQAPLYKEEDAR